MHWHLVQKTFWLWLMTIATPALAIDLTPPRGEPGELGISVGAEYTTGKYGGTTSTDIGYFPLTLHYGTQRWLGWVTIPYLTVEGPGDVVITGGGMRGHKMVTTTTTRRTESGIGDIIAAASFRLLTQTETRPALDLTGKVYFGTADETQGLGTGENDYAVQLGLTKNIRAWTGSGTAGYLLTGDPASVTYKDVFYGKLDVARNFQRHAIGLAFEAQQATVAAGDAPAKLTGYLSTRPGKHSMLTGYLLQGYSDAAPDWGAGVLFTLQY
jgi:hypothetical protein